MSYLAPGVKDGLYEEVYCLKDMSMIHVDFGNIEVKEGEKIAIDGYKKAYLELTNSVLPE